LDTDKKRMERIERRRQKLIPRIVAREQRQLIFDWKRQGCRALQLLRLPTKKIPLSIAKAPYLSEHGPVGRNGKGDNPERRMLEAPHTHLAMRRVRFPLV
jgi:hypothetical protein